jgi:hypothetical protein
MSACPGPGKRAADVVVVGPEIAEFLTDEPRPGRPHEPFRQLAAPLRVAKANGAGIVALLELLGRVVPDRLQHPVPDSGPRVPPPQEALVEEGLERVGIGAADSLGRLVRPVRHAVAGVHGS